MSSLVFLQYLTTVFDSIEDAIILINADVKDQFRLLMANEAFYRNSGYTKEDIGKLLQKIVPPELYADIRAHCHSVIDTRTSVEYAAAYTVPLGTLTYHIKFIPILNAVGEVIQIAGIIHDITELEILREKVAQTTNTLASLSENLKITSDTKV